MKAQLRIPTSEPYAYIEPTVEGTPEEIVSAYEEFTTLVRPKMAPLSDEELKDRQFNAIFDKYISGAKLTSEEYESRTVAQKQVLQCVKRSMARLKESVELRTRKDLIELKCEVCGKQDETVTRRACGYAQEINDTVVMETICDSCEREHLMDI